MKYVLEFLLKVLKWIGLMTWWLIAAILLFTYFVITTLIVLIWLFKLPDFNQLFDPLDAIIIYFKKLEWLPLLAFIYVVSLIIFVCLTKK